MQKSTTVVHKQQKAKGYEEYADASTTAKRSIKADKKEYVNMLATKTQGVVLQGNLRELYITTKKLSGKLGKLERPVKGKWESPSLMKKARRRDGWSTFTSY